MDSPGPLTWPIEKKNSTPKFLMLTHPPPRHPPPTKKKKKKKTENNNNFSNEKIFHACLKEPITRLTQK